MKYIGEDSLAPFDNEELKVSAEHAVVLKALHLLQDVNGSNVSTGMLADDVVDESAKLAHAFGICGELESESDTTAQFAARAILHGIDREQRSVIGEPLRLDIRYTLDETTESVKDSNVIWSREPDRQELEVTLDLLRAPTSAQLDRDVKLAIFEENLTDLAAQEQKVWTENVHSDIELGRKLHEFCRQAKPTEPTEITEKLYATADDRYAIQIAYSPFDDDLIVTMVDTQYEVTDVILCPGAYEKEGWEGFDVPEFRLVMMEFLESDTKRELRMMEYENIVSYLRGY